MTTKKKIIIGVSVALGLVVAHALIGKDKNEGRSKYGLKVYNLIKHGKFTDKMEIKAITNK